MRGRVIVWVIAGLAALMAVELIATARGGGDGESVRPPQNGSAQGAMLGDREVAAGAIDVGIHPRRFDGEEAVFHISMDTHSVELDMDMARGASLEVGGVPWAPATWTGDGPSGHHREGELRFAAAGEAGGRIVLTLDGFTIPVTAAWDR